MREARDKGEISHDIGGGILMACVGLTLLWVVVALTPTVIEGLRMWFERTVG